MQEVEKTIREYGQKRLLKSLQDYVSTIDTDEINLLIKRRVNNTDFSVFWSYLLQGLDVDNLHDKRYNVTTALINELKERNINTSQANSLITRLCMELPKFTTSHLVSLCVLCVSFIQKGDVTEICWRELLPELLNVIIERKVVEFNSNETSGLEFKKQYINSLCMLEWSCNIIIPLTMVFIEIPLTKEEHLQVVCKLVSYIDKLMPQELPAFVYQLLKLCQNQNSKLLFYKLQNYFGLRVYSNPILNANSDSEGFDIISDSADEEPLQAESTVLYHIYQSAILGHESIRDYLSSLVHLTKSPEFILHPFQLTVLLTISTVTFYEDKIFELLRQCITRKFTEELKRTESCWLRNLVPDTLKLEDILIKIIRNGLNERDLVLQGLINLGFMLLGVGALLGRDSLIVKRKWNLGKTILLNLVKEKPHIAHTILQRLRNHIIIGNNTSQYIDCFRDFSIKFKFLTLENKSCVIELMEALVNVPEYHAETILDIVIPLTKVSPTIRDHLILLLRKALYSRSTETRQVAVKGFLKLLTKLKISSLTVLSQINSSFSSGHSVLTQISLHKTAHSSSQPSTFSNEAICLEVLNILRRSFMQQADVRNSLYVGLHDAICHNPDLTIPVLNLLWSQFMKYYVADAAVLPPIDFSQISIIRDVDVILQEPIGQLTAAISFLIVKIQETENEEVEPSKYTDVFDVICERLIKCELMHFKLDDGTNLSDILPESKQKVVILKQAMCLYEAFIGYKILSWNKTSQRHAEQINSLFQGFFRLQQCAKNVAKPKKAEKKKKTNNKTTQQNQTLQTSSQGQTQQNETITKNAKPVQIKVPRTVLDFKILIKFLSLLHETVDWTTLQQANLLKVKHNIHQHVMQAALSHFQLLKNQKGIERNREYYSYCRDVAKIIYPKCIKRLEEFIEFDVTTAISAVECFNIILSIVATHFGNDFKSFLSTVGAHENDGDLLTHLTPFIEKYQKLFELDDHSTDDNEMKRILHIISSTTILLASHIPPSPNLQATQFLDWLKTHATDCTVTSKNVANNFISLWFSTYIKHNSNLSVFKEVIENLFEVLGCLEENEGSTSLKIVNELTVQTFIQCLTSTIKILLENLDWMTNRLRSEYGVLTYAGDESLERRKEQLINKERSICCQMCLMIPLIEDLCNVRVPIGQSELVIKDISFLYNSLNTLTKYFITRSSKLNLAFRSARFEEVVKVAGKRVAPTWNRFILYIEESQKEEVQTEQAKKKNSSTLKNKILKETKLIPKVVFEVEQFTKSIIILSNKTKYDLAALIGSGTTRDFRITRIRDVLEKNTSMDVSQTDSESTEHNSTMDTEEQVEEDDGDQEEDSRPKKRLKTK